MKSTTRKGECHGHVAMGQRFGPGDKRRCPTKCGAVAAAFWTVSAVLVVGVACLGVLEAQTPPEPDQTAPVIEMLVPGAGELVRELVAVEVVFSEPVQGVDAADLLVGGTPATEVTTVLPGHYLFSFPQPPDGLVQVAWSESHGIADLADPPNAFTGGTWTYSLDSTKPADGLMISEFMADNGLTLKDDDGNYSDWIEVFNASDESASLNGWFLTDTNANLAKWRFPAYVLPARSYLVVFASGANKTNLAKKLHTNFKLANGGEYLALVSPETNVISEFAPVYPEQYTDVSYGRVQGTPNSTGYFMQATPGGPNVESGQGFSPFVHFSRCGGPFTAPFELTLSTGDPEAVIRYTLDGTIPTASSSACTGPIPITNSVPVRARAFSAGLVPGPLHSETYLLLGSGLPEFTSTLPVMIIDTLGKGTPSASRQTLVHFSLHEPVYGRTSLTNAPVVSGRAGIKVRGSSTEGLSKSSFALELWNEYGQDKAVGLLGMPPDSDWVLYAPNGFDPVLIHNPFAHQLSRDMGVYSPRTKFLEVYLVRSAGPVASTHYYGIFVLEEKIKIGGKRVDIDKLAPEDVTSPEVTGGYLLKIDRMDPGDTGFNAGGTAVCYVDPKEKEIKFPQRDPQEQYIKNHLSAFARALTSANFRDPNLGYPAYIDVDEWIDFHVHEVLTGNVDALVLSTYFHKPRDGKVAFGPHWDFDRALGSTDGRDSNPRVWSTGPFFSAAWWSRLFSDLDFWQKWVDRWQDLRQSHFSIASLHSLVDRLADEVREAQPREKKRWNIPLRGGGYQGEVNLMKNWLSNRIDFIDKQLAQPPTFSAFGGPVPPGFELAMTCQTGGTIYYTLDGTDPRAARGGISASAILYSAPVRLDANARVVARVRNLLKKQNGGPPSTTPWSAPVAATFVIETPRLAITEIMFHPSPLAGVPNPASDFEYIELKNVLDKPLALPGFRISGGVDYLFSSSSAIAHLEPGERVVLVKNLEAFRLRYPNVANVAGQFTGALGNEGNRLTIEGPMREPVLDFRYEDSWCKAADGPGFSLVLKDETAPLSDLGDGGNWRASSRTGGSPGDADPPPPAFSRVLINELLPDSDGFGPGAIEVFNPTAEAADISGWYLTDDLDQPFDCQLSSRARIPANGYAVIEAFDYWQGDNGRLRFPHLGSGIYLVSARPDGELSGYVHGFEFGPTEEGVSVGRHVANTGAEEFVRQAALTLGGANAGPAVGPVVVSEIMFNPPDGGASGPTGFEYLELCNPTGQNVALFDRNRPTNTWRFRGAIEFDLPAGIELAPGSRLLIVGFDPASADAELQAFRAQYNVEASALVIGPWKGRLDNAGEPVRLLKPIETEEPDAGQGLLPCSLVEAVAYQPTAPWPSTASNSGWALHRRHLLAYGSDPQNWMTGPPTAGAQDSDQDNLPDAWERAFGLDPLSSSGDSGAEGDLDGDGCSNWQEFAGRTNPADPSSYPRIGIFRASREATLVSTNLAPAQSYTIQFTDDLSQGSWRNLRSLTIPPETNSLLIKESMTNSARFYRLRTP